MIDREMSAEELAEARRVVYAIRDDAVELMGPVKAAALLLSLARDMGDQLGIPREQQSRDFLAAWGRAAWPAKGGGHD